MPRPGAFRQEIRVLPLLPAFSPRSHRCVGEDERMTSDVFVGRAQELEQLRELLAASGERQPVTAMLAGEPGVGKSRLLRQFADSARGGGSLVLRGACIELGGGAIPYAPLIDALRLVVRTRGEDEARRIVGPAWDELSDLVADFTGAAARPGGGGRPSAVDGSQLRVFGAVLRALDHLGAQAPVAVIFEDLHWADQSTLDLVSYLTRAKTTERAMITCSHRTNLAPGHPLRELLAEPDFAQRTRRLEVPRFGEADLRRFLGTLGPVDRDLVRRGFELSEGNAYFAEQLMLSGMLTESGHRLPESLSEQMLSRIRTLSRGASRVLRVAATAARRVDDRLLAAVCGLSDDELDEALRECLDKAMLSVDPDDDTYTVRHELLREAVYKDLQPRERRRLHTEMAEAISAEAGREPQDLGATVELAHHWDRAGRSPEALGASARAGAMTARMRAFHESATQYERVLRLWPSVTGAEQLAGTPREEVLAAAADAARWSGHVARAVELIHQAVALVDAHAEPRRAGELYERLGSYQWEAGAHTESVEAYEKAATLLASGTADAVDARVAAGLATALLRRGRYADGLVQAQAAIELADSVQAAAEKGRALNTAGVALAMLGRAEEGVAYSREALRIAEATEHLEDLFRAYGNLGVVLEHAGDLPGSVEILTAGLDRVRGLGLDGARQAGVLANNAGAAMFLLGRWRDAVDLLEELLLEHPPVRESLYQRLTLAEVQLARGRFDEAARLLAEVKEYPNTDPRFLGSLYACEAELLIWRGDLPTAEATVGRGFAAISDTENDLVRLRLCAVGLRAAADRCLAEAAEAAEADANISLNRSAVWAAEARRTIGGDPVQKEIEALGRLCAAERARALRSDMPELWDEVARAWEGLGRPYPAAYARWREASAAVAVGDRETAARALAAASEGAERLAAEPLRDAVAAPAGEAGPVPTVAPASSTSDSPPPGPADKPSAAAHGLTPRELDVLRLVADGHGNRRIGKELFIAEGTVAVHIHRILAKLGVASRAEAISLAYRTGLVEVPVEGGKERPWSGEHC
jgi:predicted ATPase/DNA-binding CsgD family transcriptional regulator